GSEFLNWHLYRHFSGRKQPIQFTRSRPYHKNDNAHIEEKNWSHLRQYLGYQRFDNPILVKLLNELYTSEWYLYFNFFMPSVKLLHKVRSGSKIIKKYDSPKTPFQRLLQSPAISESTKKDLKKQFQELNPFILQKHMTEKIKHILNLAASSEDAELLRNSASSELTKNP
ncbi:MAG: ISNCY family transposase, partial [Calditrichia bacterium]|nr:ISNCY family transposase [Calditrichia bacterium]